MRSLLKSGLIVFWSKEDSKSRAEMIGWLMTHRLGSWSACQTEGYPVNLVTSSRAVPFRCEDSVGSWCLAKITQPVSKWYPAVC